MQLLIDLRLVMTKNRCECFAWFVIIFLWLVYCCVVVTICQTRQSSSHDIGHHGWIQLFVYSRRVGDIPLEFVQCEKGGCKRKAKIIAWRGMSQANLRAIRRRMYDCELRSENGKWHSFVSIGFDNMLLIMAS